MYIVNLPDDALRQIWNITILIFSFQGPAFIFYYLDQNPLYK